MSAARKSSGRKKSARNTVPLAPRNRAGVSRESSAGKASVAGAAAIKRTRRLAFRADEYVRVVPLHQPRPSLGIAELKAAREGDVFDGQVHLATLDAHLTYRGGALLTNVEVYTIFWGKQWASAGSARTLLAQINQFFTDILVSPLIDQLAEYNVPGKKIGPGKFTGTKTITANAPSASVTDTQIQAQLKQWIKASTIPKNNRNTLYFLFLDPHVVSIMGGAKSCQSFCGYHSNTGAVYYAVMPYPTCAGCLGGLTALHAITGTSSHELCEAITDPIPGMGWYDDKNGEIGDICAWSFKQIAGHTVQLEWSNAQNKCV
jgi:hypothetical protein